MNKFCVFCGQRPSSKHKEHIIPQWLIELTGNPNRLANFGNIFDIKEMRLVEKEFAFDQFKFPSCEKCNEEYSDFENKARNVVLRVTDDEALSALDIHNINETYANVPIAWQAEYGIVSFSEKALATIVEYVKNQKAHHKQNTIKETLENLSL